MKKILLMLAMLLPCVGVIAEVLIPAEGQFYAIKNLRSSKYATYAGDNAQLRQEANKNINAIWYVTDVVTLEDGVQCKLHNAVTSNIYAAYNSFTTNGVTAYIKKNPYNAEVVCVSITENLGSNCWDDQGGQTTIGNYNPRSGDHQGTSWIFENITSEVTNTTANYVFTAGNVTYNGSCEYVAFGDEVTTLAVKALGATLENAKINEGILTAGITFPFPVSNAEVTNKLMINGYAANSLNFKIYAKENTYVKVQKAGNPTTENVDNYLWAIYPNIAEGTYTIKNIATDKYIFSSATDKAHGNTTLEFSETSTPFVLVKDGWGYSFKVADKTLYLSVNTSNSDAEQPVGLWGNTHAGSSWRFIPYVVKYTLTDAANNAFTGEYEGWAGFETALPAFTGAQGYSVTGHVWNADLNTLTATITFPGNIVVSSESVLNPTLISSFKANSKYPQGSFKWFVEGDNVKILRAATITSSTIGSYLWAIYPSLTNNEFTFKIKSLATGKCLSSDKAYANNAGNHVADDVKLVDFENAKEFYTNNNGQFYYVGSNGVNQYLSWGSENTDSGYLGVYAKSHNGTTNLFPATTYTVTVGDAGYATLYSPVAGTFAGEVKTYAIESASGNSATLAEKVGVAANQGVIVKATPGTYTFTAGAVESDWTSNQLLGSAANTYVAGEAYVLALVDGNAALTLAELNKNANGETGDSHFLNNAGKAYLPASAVVSGARSLFFFNNGTTGIEETIVAPVFNANAPIFDLSGRRVNNTVKGGIYIQNGKKFIVK
ncbi:MAG: hypothetical protein J6S02_01905 [Bacteroidaceae bacterium]|nr:hypothetical protein [Bacteroidaceae bacterium]